MAHIKKQSSISDLVSVFMVFRKNVLENIKREGLKCDLTFSQAEVLDFIRSSGGETMKNIAHYLKITPPSATEIVAEMEKKGLVKRQSDKNDRRIVFIVLTPTAKKLSVSLHKGKESVLKKMLSKLSEKDRKGLERIIKIIIKN